MRNAYGPPCPGPGVAFLTVGPDELDRRLRERPDALGPTPRAELLHVLMLPDFERVGAIQSYWGNPQDPNIRRAPDRLRGGPGPFGRC